MFNSFSHGFSCLGIGLFEWSITRIGLSSVFSVSEFCAVSESVLTLVIRKVCRNKIRRKGTLTGWQSFMLFLKCHGITVTRGLTSPCIFSLHVKIVRHKIFYSHISINLTGEEEGDLHELWHKPTWHVNFRWMWISSSIQNDSSSSNVLAAFKSLNRS